MKKTPSIIDTYYKSLGTKIFRDTTALPFADGGPLNDRNIHGDLLPSVYASALGNYYGNGGQMKPDYSLPEDSFQQGGHGLKNSVYASSMGQYPAPYAMGGELNIEECPPGYKNVNGVCVPIIGPESDWYKLTTAQKDLLQKGNNLDTVQSWYEQNPKDMELFKPWLDEHDSQTYLNQLDPNSEESKKFNEALNNSRQWNQDWYSKRKELPQFKDIAEQRLAINNTDIQSSLKDPVNLSMDWWKKYEQGKVPNVFYAPEIGGITRKNKADYNINQGYTREDPLGHTLQRSYFTDKNGKLQSSLITHEETHVRDHLAPQLGTKKNIRNNEWDQPGVLDPIEKIISSTEALEDPRNEGYNNAYQQQPTEVRARLNVWRMQNGIDPVKNYTEGELKSIIDKDLQNPNLNDNVKELYQTIKNDPNKLKFIHDSYVENKLPNTSSSFTNTLAQGGAMNQYPDGGAIYTYAGRPGSYYQKDENGQWLISNKGTGGQYVPVDDPSGQRTAILNKGAVVTMANPTANKYNNVVPSYGKSPMVQSVAGRTEAERHLVQNAIAGQQFAQNMEQDYAAATKNQLPQHEQPLDMMDYAWQGAMGAPMALKGLQAVSALKIPFTEMSLGTAANVAGGIHGATQIPNRVQDWQDVAAGGKTWQEATAKTIGTGLEVGAGAAEGINAVNMYKFNPAGISLEGGQVANTVYPQVITSPTTGLKQYGSTTLLPFERPMAPAGLIKYNNSKYADAALLPEDQVPYLLPQSEVMKKKPWLYQGKDDMIMESFKSNHNSKPLPYEIPASHTVQEDIMARALGKPLPTRVSKASLEPKIYYDMDGNIIKKPQ